jgi:hypothetical protein
LAEANRKRAKGKPRFVIEDESVMLSEVFEKLSFVDLFCLNQFCPGNVAKHEAGILYKGIRMAIYLCMEHMSFSQFVLTRNLADIFKKLPFEKLKYMELIVLHGGMEVIHTGILLALLEHVERMGLDKYRKQENAAAQKAGSMRWKLL